MSGPFSSVVNFSVAEFLRRAEKLSVLQTIELEAESHQQFPFLFPRHHKQAKLKSNSTSAQSTPTSYTIDDVERTVQRAFNDACELLAPLDLAILNNHQNAMTIDEVSVFIKSHLEKTAMVKHPRHQKDHSDSSIESDSDSSSDSTESIQTMPGAGSGQEESDAENDQEESDSEYLSNVDDCQFRGMRVYDNVKPSVAQSYFKLTINGIPKFLHKQTACWMLTHEKSSLSSDRLNRVRVKNSSMDS
jgi:hypothetical protein